MPPVLFLLGPTASGKTALALSLVEQLADRFPIELVSVDSALVYRDMNIGTAKPDAATLLRYPHHLVNLLDPHEAYSAARFYADANAAISSIHARGHIPLLVGGTMLYVKALVDGLSTMPPADAAIRQRLAARLQSDGLPALYVELARVDAVTAARLKPADTQRILRALEVFLISGKPISLLQQRAKNPASFPYQNLLIGLLPSDRAVLHQRIADRFDAMLAAGLIDEVRALRERYTLTPDLPSMRCVGYRQAWQFIDGKIDQITLRETGIAATRQLAKRQLTWLRSLPPAESFDCLNPDLTEAVVTRVNTFLEQLQSP